MHEDTTDEELRTNVRAHLPQLHKMPTHVREMPIREVVPRLVDHIVGEGVPCPACKQRCKMYRRKVTSAMAVWLVKMVLVWDGTGRDWVQSNHPELKNRGGDYAKLQLWGLIRAPKNTKRAGRWQPTKLGHRFANKKATIHKYAFTYNDKYLGKRGEQITIDDALGSKFNRDEIEVAL